jgi:acyl dehydratase
VLEGVGAAALMTEEQAVEHLDLAGDPFVFHLDPATGRGRVLYRRFDGNYGLITAS